MISLLLEGLHQLLPITFRILGVLALLPILPGGFGAFKKIGWALAFSLLFLGRATSNDYQLFDLVVEFIIGLGLGLPPTLFLHACSIWGELFDFERGHGLGQVYDPHFQGVQSHVAKLAFQLSWVVALSGGVVELTLKALSSSLDLVSAGHGIEVLSEHGVTQVAAILLARISALLGGTFCAFLPVGVLFLFAELCIGLIVKVVPQVQAQPLSYSLKSAIGFLLIVMLLNGGFDASFLTIADPNTWYKELYNG